MIKTTDVLVIGSGAAGLIYALKVAKACPDKEVIIITKSKADESNTKYAQGGVAVVWNTFKDNFASHVTDTLRAGDGKCKREVVEMVVADAPERIKELIEFGVAFDLGKDGEYDLGREGGHSQHRVIHHKDNTGEAIEEALLKKVKATSNITILEFHLAIDLLLSANKKQCIGADVLDLINKKAIRVYSAITLLATGGCGGVFENTTNPPTSIGDGIALAHKAGVSISNMQYIQFHPTVIYEKDGVGKLSLITEAMRGAGAKLLNVKHERFMAKYDDRLELASRDIVSRAIYQEMKLHNSKFVYLDCRDIDKDKLLAHFPNIYQECKQRGYNLFTDLLPIVPASHYLCGGIDVDMDGKTNISNLYAIGECSNTGLHGANRLASNSLLEALVYGHKAAESSIDRLKNMPENKEISSESNLQWADSDKKIIKEITNIKKNLNKLMSDYVGIVRNNSDLLTARNKCTALEERLSLYYNPQKTNQILEETKNMLTVGKLIIQQSIDQKENAGTFYNIDLQ